MDINDLARDLKRGHRHRNGRALEIDSIIGNKGIDKIEIGAPLAVKLDHLAANDFDRGLGIVRAVHGNKAHLGPLANIAVQIDGTRVKRLESFGSFHFAFLSKGNFVYRLSASSADGKNTYNYSYTLYYIFVQKSMWCR